MEDKATNTICRILLEPKKSLDEFGENAIFQPWEFMDVPADELQENDVIAFLCDGDIGDLIVVTNKARIYKFNWEEPAYYADFALGDADAAKHEKHTVEKCIFCTQRVARGEQPACVADCIGRARHFGDLDDPNSEVSRLLASREYTQLHTEFGTKPSVYYLV